MGTIVSEAPVWAVECEAADDEGGTLHRGADISATPDISVCLERLDSPNHALSTTICLWLRSDRYPSHRMELDLCDEVLDDLGTVARDIAAALILAADVYERKSV